MVDLLRRGARWCTAHTNKTNGKTVSREAPVFAMHAAPYAKDRGIGLMMYEACSEE